MKIVLLEPEIPPNTGNIARLCAATNTELHLIEPFGFDLTDKQLQRAGMDYWQHVRWFRWKCWDDFLIQTGTTARLWFIESAGQKHYAEVKYGADDSIIFGRETAGLPRRILDQYQDAWLRIPMFNPKARSLNLSNCAALVLYEALRQQGFPGEAGGRVD